MEGINSKDDARAWALVAIPNGQTKTATSGSFADAACEEAANRTNAAIRANPPNPFAGVSEDECSPSTL